jgi:hypothetical protein
MTANKNVLISKLSYNPTKQKDKSKKTIEETDRSSEKINNQILEYLIQNMIPTYNFKYAV